MSVGLKSIIGRKLITDLPGYAPADISVMSPDQLGRLPLRKNNEVCHNKFKLMSGDMGVGDCNSSMPLKKLQTIPKPVTEYIGVLGYICF